MLTTETILYVPAGNPQAVDLQVDLGSILIAETRQAEVATVTPTKAPELLATFNASWRDLHQLITKLTAERVEAEKEVAKRRAKLLLEVVPKELERLDVASTIDSREAVVTLDEERERLQDRVDQLVAVVEFLKGKLKSFENSFTSVKKIMGEDTYNYGGSNKNLSGDTQSPGRARATVTSTEAAPPARPGFGRAKV